MIKLSAAFNQAYARWRGDIADVGPGKAPATTMPVDDFDRVFREWEHVAFDQLVDRMSAGLVEDAGVDFDDAPTDVIPVERLRRTG